MRWLDHGGAFDICGMFVIHEVVGFLGVETGKGRYADKRSLALYLRKQDGSNVRILLLRPDRSVLRSAAYTERKGALLSLQFRVYFEIWGTACQATSYKS